MNSLYVLGLYLGENHGRPALLARPVEGNAANRFGLKVNGRMADDRAENYAGASQHRDEAGGGRGAPAGKHRAVRGLEGGAAS